MNKIKVLLVKPNREAQCIEIVDDIKQLQQLVGGYIQSVYPFPDEVALICNDEGKLLNLPPNRALFDDKGNVYDIVCGDFLVVGARNNEDTFSSLTTEEIEKFTNHYNTHYVIA